MTTDLNQAIREEALKRAKAEVKEIGFLNGDDAHAEHLARATARIVQDLTKNGWKPTTPGGELWSKAWEAYTCVLEAPANACVDDVDVTDLADRAAVAVLDEFIETERTVPTYVLEAVSKLMREHGNLPDTNRLRISAETLDRWINRHG